MADGTNSYELLGDEYNHSVERWCAHHGAKPGFLGEAAAIMRLGQTLCRELLARAQTAEKARDWNRDDANKLMATVELAACPHCVEKDAELATVEGERARLSEMRQRGCDCSDDDACRFARERDEVKERLVQLQAERDELRASRDSFEEALEGLVDPITGDKFFMVIGSTGDPGLLPEGWYATFGGPYDSYTMCHRNIGPDNKPTDGYSRWRHDHDKGCWRESEHVSAQVIDYDEQAAVGHDELLDLRQNAAAIQRDALIRERNDCAGVLRQLAKLVSDDGHQRGLEQAADCIAVRNTDGPVLHPLWVQDCPRCAELKPLTARAARVPSDCDWGPDDFAAYADDVAQLAAALSPETLSWLKAHTP